MSTRRPTRPPTGWSLAVAAALAVGPLAGCGAGGAGAVSKPDYLSKGNAICRDQAAQIRRLHTPRVNLAAAGPRQLRAVASYFDRAVPIVSAHFQQLQQLSQPSQDRPLLTQVLVRARELLELLQAVDRQARAGDVAGFRADLRSAGQISNESHALALRYGLAACAQG